MNARTSSDWRDLLRQWLATMPSGRVFKSRDAFAWAEQACPAAPCELKPVNASGRPIWRHRLSIALRDLYATGELQHPGIAAHTWRVP
ncbi:MAG: hypothetical protein VKK97_10155 [Synechococcaceae cyanobacterium]|nr:hypothetical protein [Synechococcaceae cyanobacterium]